MWWEKTRTSIETSIEQSEDGEGIPEAAQRAAPVGTIKRPLACTQFDWGMQCGRDHWLVSGALAGARVNGCTCLIH